MKLMMSFHGHSYLSHRNRFAGILGEARRLLAEPWDHQYAHDEAVALGGVLLRGHEILTSRLRDKHVWGGRHRTHSSSESNEGLGKAHGLEKAHNG